MASPDAKDIESLVELFNRSDWDEMHLKTDDLEIFLSNDPNAPGPSRNVAGPAAPTVTAEVRSAAQAELASATDTSASVESPIPDGLVAVRAPNLGTFYRAPKPGAPAYVEIGQAVQADTEVCLIEVMKLFTPVRAGVAGVVREIRIQDGQMVEFGQLLVVVEPAG
ncbi:MAG: acetyl-CoA carboxylase biotin carboxyl carrier protein [Proteobacteria bacterium]|nr:acetyl-CoA carboxylase biotin carboxyl carrier protein [Pseudomonadota bacterium]